MSPLSTTSDVRASAAVASAMPDGGSVPCVAQLAVLLAGQSSSTRAPRISTSLGIPTAALPITAERSLAECWIRRLALAGFRGTVVIAAATAEEARYYRQIRPPELPAPVPAAVEGPSTEPIAIEVRVDTSSHRGPAGTLGDIAQERIAAGARNAVDGGMLVIEASNPPNADLPKFLAAIDPTQGALVGAAVDGSPCGVLWLSDAAIALVPRIGFYDLKEQMVPAIVASGRKVHAWMGSHESCRVSDRVSFLRAVALMQAAGAAALAPDAIIETGATVRGSSIVCRGAAVERGALVVDSVVMPGARVCADAVVARSIVPPGSHVPRGYLVVDEVFGALGSATKYATEGGAS